MPMNVEITFTGDVIISKRAAGWEVVAVTDAVHTAKQTSTPASKLDGDMRRALEFTTVNFVHEKVSPDMPEDGDLWNFLLNISAENMHGVDPKTNRSRLIGEWNEDGKNEIVKFFIQGAKAFVTETVDGYWIEEYNVPNSCQSRREATATEVTFKFAIDGTEGLIREIVGKSGQSRERFAYVEGSTLYILIDNDCKGGSGSYTDFLRYYAYLKEAQPAGGRQRQFICGKDESGTYCADPADKSVETLSARMMSVYGNCDPVGSDPPLWP